LEETLRRLESRLAARVEAFVRTHGAGSFCVALLYEAGMPLPVTPVLGPSDHAVRALADPSVLWHPAEWPEFHHLAEQGAAAIEQDDDIREMTATVMHLDAVDSAHRADRIVAALNRAAARLTRSLADLDSEPSPRYVAYAVDVTGADLHSNFHAAVDAHLRRALNARSMLP
jgi:hypothetical protein